MEGKYLITTDNWFYAPDGQQYKAVWGEVEILKDDILGIKTNRQSTNWYLKVGSGEKFTVVAGCQIHYAVRCPEKPENGPVTDYRTNDTTGVITYERPGNIWIAE